MSSIRLSPKHGVNPSLMLCYYCGAEVGVALPGLLKGDVEAPRKAVWDMRPCDQCIEWMAKGIILISVADGEPPSDNPTRTGGFCVVTEDAARRVMGDTAMCERVLKKRVAFIEDRVWKAVGLPPLSPSAIPRNNRGQGQS